MGVEARAASPALTEALKDSNDRVRSNAAYALGQIGVEARSAAPALGEVLKTRAPGRAATRRLRSARSAKLSLTCHR